MSSIEEIRMQIQAAVEEETAAIAQGAEGLNDLSEGVSLMQDALDGLRGVISKLHQAEEKFKDSARAYAGAGAVALQATERLEVALNGSSQSGVLAREYFAANQQIYTQRTASIRASNATRGEVVAKLGGIEEAITTETRLVAGVADNAKVSQALTYLAVNAAQDLAGNL